MAEAEQNIAPLIRIVDQTRVARSTLNLVGRPSTSKRTGEGEKQNSLDTADAQVEEPNEVTKLNKYATDSTRPLIAVTMGSDSDLSILKPGLEILEELDVPYSLTITSAHRTPERMFKFAKEAVRNGYKVIIAAAGGAAHLPGMIAASTTLPVIGIPVKTSSLEGLDSLLSIVQMPVSIVSPETQSTRRTFLLMFKQRGCPVATVAINNSVNAAQLAVRILATSDEDIRKRLESHLEAQTSSVIDKAEMLESLGFKRYNSAK